MAQTESPTNFAYVTTAALLNANAMYVTCDEGIMSDFATNTDAPDVEIVTNGFGRQAGTRLIVTTTVDDDTAQIYYLYTANANQNVNGHEVMSAAASGNMWAWCHYAATQPLQTNDTINCVTNFQIKIG